METLHILNYVGVFCIHHLLSSSARLTLSPSPSHSHSITWTCLSAHGLKIHVFMSLWEFILLSYGILIFFFHSTNSLDTIINQQNLLARLQYRQQPFLSEEETKKMKNTRIHNDKCRSIIFPSATFLHRNRLHFWKKSVTICGKQQHILRFHRLFSLFTDKLAKNMKL